MHPNDNLYLLALLFAVPLSSAVPIFSGSNDIDENGNFLLKGANAVKISVREAEALDRRDIFGDIMGTFENTVGGLAEGILGPVMGKRDQPSYGILTRRDVVGDLNGVIDAANQAFGTIAGDVSQGLNPPDIPHIPSKRSFGDLGPLSVHCMAVDGICDPQPVCAGGPGFCPGDDHLDVGGVAKRDQKRGLVGDLPSKRSFGNLAPINAAAERNQKRGLVGDLQPAKRSLPGGFICDGINCFPNPDIFPDLSDQPLTAAPVDGYGDDVAQDVTSDSSTSDSSTSDSSTSDSSTSDSSTSDSSTSSDSSSTSDSSTSSSDSAKAKRGTLPPRQLSSGSIVGKRDVVGELNGLIGEANQAFDKIAGDIAPNLNPPDIPNIPTT